MFKFNFLAKFIGAGIVVMFITGCGSLHYTIKDPIPSTIDYERKDSPVLSLTIIDKRTGDDSAFLTHHFDVGASMPKAVNIQFDNIKDPISYFAKHLENEFNSRKIPIKCVVGQAATGGLTLIINRYQIANLRATSFAPWESFHMFSGTIIKNGQEKTIKSYFYNGKVPVWSMNEIEEPCFSIPMSIIIKDVASKINQAVLNLRTPDVKVDRIIAEIDSEISKNIYSNFWRVLELGYTNNPKAVEPLTKYAQIGDEFFKSCALSSIGTLGAVDRLEFLKQQYSNSRTYNDRYMAAKAIGDIGTPKAFQILQTMKKDIAYEQEGGLKYCVDLYVP
jgi:hypothetical protein